MSTFADTLCLKKLLTHDLNYWCKDVSMVKLNIQSTCMVVAWLTPTLLLYYYFIQMLTTHLTISFVKKVIQFCVGKYTLFFIICFQTTWVKIAMTLLHTPQDSGVTQ
jgi:hypothetical protein